ncbi:trypsin-like serine peptidase [Arthrobacter cupressi]|uniref:V8-like Glu-specific endopeptidase n=1 Tax=Arthrobacter cupressi TaxID=1045773 RepID=A0A1G8IHL1_9MICC|nr:hypothetical protein [Arthrobacter cupressi]NYD79022.1 hypothetical protein [Arthrobacter cupressi]SDI18383.1 V8-like Glu-specific endopeptidase [Arthrobacter cupressi]
MTRTKTLATSLLGLSAAALFAFTSAGGASATSASPDTKEVPQTVSATLQTSGVADYWTPERMRSAIPGDVLAQKALERGGRTTSRADVVQGLATKIAGKAGKGKPSLHTDEAPVSHIGKVFFTLGGANYVCSGNSVTSANESTVSTAGHCLNEGPGAFATNFVFVPAYLNGAAPYGKWTARALYTTTQWSSGGDIQYDTGFAVVSPLNGQTLADTVGASGVEFNAARGLTYKAFGYPAASPFDGQSLKACSGTAVNDTINPGGTTQGIPCDMTGGSSGGPWFIGTGSGGYQNSINSYGYGSRSTTMYGPYWGSVIQQAYNNASAN